MKRRMCYWGSVKLTTFIAVLLAIFIEVPTSQASKIDSLAFYDQCFEDAINDDVDRAIFCLKRTIYLAEKRGDNRALAKALRELGKQYHYQNNADSALVYLHEALTLLQNLEDSTSIGRVSSILGGIYSKEQLVDSSIFYHKMAMNHARYGSVDWAYLLFNYEVSKMDLGFLDSANENFKKIRKIGVDSADTSLEVFATNGLLSLTLKQSGNQVHEDIAIIRSSIERMEDPTLSILLRQNLFSALNNLNRYNEAGKEKEIIDSLMNKYSVESSPHYLHSFAEYNRNIGNDSMAIEQARSLLSKYPEYENKKDLILILIELNERNGNSDSTLHYVSVLDTYHQKIQEDKRVQALRAMDENIELMRLKTEQIQREKQSAIAQLKIRNQRIVVALLVLLNILAGALAYSIYNRKKLLKTRKDLELKEKSKALTELSLRMAHKNQLINDMNDALNVDSADLGELKIALKSILINNTSLESDWDQFRIYFEDIHEGFYEKLKKLYPDLTTTDLRLCSLIKLRLNLKEIASMLNLTNDSVKSSRYRLRKKMSLESSLDLSDHLDSI